MSATEMVGVPIIVFLVIVAPLWIIMHYLSQARRDRMALKTPLSGEDQEMLGRMVALLEKMESRIGTLEKILDADEPRWRERRTINDRI